jgi:hypothetical protein
MTHNPKTIPSATPAPNINILIVVAYIIRSVVGAEKAAVCLVVHQALSSRTPLLGRDCMDFSNELDLAILTHTTQRTRRVPFGPTRRLDVLSEKSV